MAKNWYKPNVGIVTCAFVNRGNVIFATSEKIGDYQFHAERNTYYQFKKMYGESSIDNKFIITLSPHIENFKLGIELSCAELIKSLEIKRIHFSALNTYHITSISMYSLSFIAAVIQNNEMKQICKKLMGLFLKYNSHIDTELLTLEQELRDFF